MHRNTWRFNSTFHFNYDPIMCECGHLMKKTRQVTPVKGEEDKWHEVTFGERETFKQAFFEHFTKYCPTRY